MSRSDSSGGTLRVFSADPAGGAVCWGVPWFSVTVGGPCRKESAAGWSASCRPTGRWNSSSGAALPAALGLGPQRRLRLDRVGQVEHVGQGGEHLPDVAEG